MSDYDGGQLAKTGLGAITIGGVSYSLGGWMLGAAAALIVMGAVVIRLRFRSRKDAGNL